MKKAMKTVFNRLLAKKPENYLYAEWDKSNFKIPDELKLSETSSLGDALSVPCQWRLCRSSRPLTGDRGRAW